MEDSELLSKFDAFMKKHRNTSSGVDDIPVLTDIVTDDSPIDSNNNKNADSDISQAKEPAVTSQEENKPTLVTEVLTIEIDKSSIEENPSLVSTGQENKSSLESITRVSQLNDDDAEQLARDIYIRVMSDIDGRVSRDLRLEMTKRISAMIDKTVSAAIEDFKQELANIISDAISETLIQRTEKNSK